MQLCQNPARDWRAWVSEAADDTPDFSTASLAARYVETCRNPARDVKAWLAANDEAAPAAPPVSEVANYVQLCQNPAKDWRAWLAEDYQPRNTGGQHDNMESTERLCRVALLELQGWMDSHQRGRSLDYLPTGSTADSIQFDDVQPVRAEGGIDPAGDAGHVPRGRRFALLESFMVAGRVLVGQLVSFHKGRTGRRGKATTKGKGKASGGWVVYQLRKAQNREAKRAAILQSQNWKKAQTVTLSARRDLSNSRIAPRRCQP